MINTVIRQTFIQANWGFRIADWRLEIADLGSCIELQVMEFRSAKARLDGVLIVVALLGCIHAVTLTSPTNCARNIRESTSNAAISATDRMYLEALSLQGTLTFDNTTAFAKDWGQLGTHRAPAGVLHPTSVQDVSAIVHAAARSECELTVAARGLGSSIGGQSQAHNGIVIEMTTMKGITVVPMGDAASGGVPFVEAMGGELWVDVLKVSLEFGMAPRSWTDYLYLTVGGTLSNAGVSGQTFRHGPEVSNVLELQVVTGKGEVVDCTPTKHSELFFAVLGGLGQFGIITKARIVLEKAPPHVRWMRALYTDFATFKSDLELLISSSNPFDYIEGFVVMNNENPINGWSSVPFTRSDINATMIPSHAGAIMYCLEVTKAYSNDLHTLDQEVENMLAPLRFHRGLLFQKDTTYFKFLDRVHDLEMQLRAEGLWEIPHPWLNIFVPAASIQQFDELVLKQIATRLFSGPILVYPVHKSKWDKRLSVAVPEEPAEEIFYVVAFLRNKLPDTAGGPTLSDMLEDNENILHICEPLHCKQYLPHYQDRSKWQRHFGSKWDSFVQNKQRFDPCAILAPGLNIFSRGCSSLIKDFSSSFANFQSGLQQE